MLTLASLDFVTGISEVPSLGRLVEDYPRPLRRLFEWALDNPTEVPVDRLRYWTFADHFVIRMLGAVGDVSTAASLRMLTKDPEAGRAAVDAIRQIHRRDEQSRHSVHTPLTYEPPLFLRHDGRHGYVSCRCGKRHDRRWPLCTPRRIGAVVVPVGYRACRTRVVG